MMTLRMAAWFLVLTVTVLGGRWAQAENIDCDFFDADFTITWADVSGDWFLKMSVENSNVDIPGPSRARIGVTTSVVTYALNWTKVGDENPCKTTNPAIYIKYDDRPEQVQLGSNEVFERITTFIPFGDSALAVFDRISMMFMSSPIQFLRVFTRSKSGGVPDLTQLYSHIDAFCSTFSTSDNSTISDYSNALDCIVN
ncbi:uncharacterized protein LOC143279367 [Babylonia areolata]|uniref:uncharacterized protein LOC143279367 n=1 Tax=Babylonia areolata TaxID=304850 RepID=UPI003FD32C4D